MISVLVPVRNASEWIVEAVRSVAHQSLRPDEILVADDGSTDGTPELLEREGIPGVRILRTESRRGISWQLNRMIGEANGRWLARMDGDDISEPDRFSTQLDHMTKRGLAVCGTWSRRFGNAETFHRFATDDAEIKCGLLFSSPFCHPSVVFDRDRLGSALRYDSDFDMAEDYHLWTRLRRSGSYANVPRVLLRWRMHGSNAGTEPASAAVQGERSTRIRDLLIADYGLELRPPSRDALEKRFRAHVLDRAGNLSFLDALLQVSRLPESNIQSPAATTRSVLGRSWDLSCLLSSWSVPDMLPLWWKGRRELGSPASAEVAAKIGLKSIVGRLRNR